MNLRISSRTGHRRGIFSSLIRRCDEFRGSPAAVLIVSTMAVFTDTTVYGLVVPFIPDIVQDKLGMSSSANGILFGCFGAGVLVGAPASAYISDRWNARKWPMVMGLVGLAFTSVLFSFANSFWQLVLARLAQGVSSGVTWSISLGMVAAVYEGDSIGRATGIVFTGNTVGFVGGPFLGGVIYHAGGIHAISIFVGIITLIDLVFRLLLKEPDTTRRSRQRDSEDGLDTVQSRLIDNSLHDSEKNEADYNSESTISTIGDSATLIYLNISPTDIVEESCSDKPRASISQPLTGDLYISRPQRRTTIWDLLKEWPIITCCIMTTTITGVQGSIESSLPIYLRENYHTEELMIGVIFIVIVIPTAIVGLVAGRISDSEKVISKLAPYGRLGLIIIGSVASAIITVCIGATRSMATLIVCLVFLGITIGFAEVPIAGAIAVHIDRMGGDAYAMGYALFTISFSIGSIIIPTTIPPIMNAIGFAGAMGVTAGILAFGAAVTSIQPTFMLLKYGRRSFVGEGARVFL